MVEVIGSWLAKKLLDEILTRGKLWITQVPELEAFEKACGKIISDYPELFPSSYTTQALRHPEQKDWLEASLKSAQDDLPGSESG